MNIEPTTRIEWGNNDKVSKFLQRLRFNSSPSNNFNSGFEFGLDSRTEGVTDEKANGAPGSLNCSSAQTNYVTLPTPLYDTTLLQQIKHDTRHLFSFDDITQYSQNVPD